MPVIIIAAKILVSAIASWVLIHLLAIFGIFLAAGYVVWWFAAPRKTPCLYCRVKEEGDYCIFCRKEVGKLRYPKSIISTLLNASLFLLITLISIGLIYVEGSLLERTPGVATSSTVSFLIDDKGKYAVGEEFPMRVAVSGVGRPVNAIQADIKFDPEVLQVVDIHTDESFANIFVQKEINNEIGFARLSGGLPNPGYGGEGGVFASFIFKGLETGVTQVEFLPSSMVLANDGKGTNVLKELTSASYIIVPADSQASKEVVTLEAEVLARRDPVETKLEFYDEPTVQPDVKSARSIEEFSVEEAQTVPSPSRLLVVLAEIDQVIIDLWAGIVGVFYRV